MLTLEEQLERASMAPIRPMSFACEQDFQERLDFQWERWDPSFRQINASSWLIFDKAILTQLPLKETKEEPNDYVDRDEGFIYRIRELGDDETRPSTTTSIPKEGSVRPCRAIYAGMYVEYLIGSTGSLKFMPAKADANHVNHHAWEHENIEYVAKQGPKHFRLPRVLYHTMFEGKYAILTERVGIPLLDRPIPIKFLNRLLGQIAKAAGEMARWEAPSVQGIDGKDIQFHIFRHFIGTAFHKGERASGYAHKHLVEMGFNMSPCGFLNGHLELSNVGIDQDFNLVGFNAWCECAFVPKGFIASYVLDRVDRVSRPGDLNWELPELIIGHQRQGSASLFLNLVSQGLPNEIESYTNLLNHEDAFWATCKERDQLDLPSGEIGFLFPDTDPYYRPEVFPDESREMGVTTARALISSFPSARALWEALSYHTWFP